MFGAILFIVFVFYAFLLIVFNQGNLVSVSLVFCKFDKIAVYIPMFISFCVGFICALSIWISGSWKKRGKKNPVAKEKKEKKSKFPKDKVESEIVTENKAEITETVEELK